MKNMENIVRIVNETLNEKNKIAMVTLGTKAFLLVTTETRKMLIPFSQLEDEYYIKKSLEYSENPFLMDKKYVARATEKKRCELLCTTPSFDFLDFSYYLTDEKEIPIPATKEACKNIKELFFKNVDFLHLNIKMDENEMITCNDARILLSNTEFWKDIQDQKKGMPFFVQILDKEHLKISQNIEEMDRDGLCYFFNEKMLDIEEY